ncbi:MAG: hypothetical protein HQK49_08315 [Oligoflexia bacterium]|nr:hypothetical protein [Oligoflexia bacterium]
MNFKILSLITTILLLLFFFLFTFVGCGVKGPPRPPPKTSLPSYEARYSKKPDLITKSEAFSKSLKRALIYKMNMVGTQLELEILKQESIDYRSRRVMAQSRLKSKQTKKADQRDIRKSEESFLEAKEKEEASLERYSKLCLSSKRDIKKNKLHLQAISKNFKEYIKMLDEYKLGEKKDLSSNAIKGVDLKKHAEQSTNDYKRVVAQLEDNIYSERLKEIEKCEDAIPGYNAVKAQEQKADSKYQEEQKKEREQAMQNQNQNTEQDPDQELDLELLDQLELNQGQQGQGQK